MIRLKTKLSNLKPDSFFCYDDNDEAVILQLQRVSNGTFHMFAVAETEVQYFTDDVDTTVYLINEVPAELLKNLGRNKAVHSVENKMKYVVSRIQEGPLCEEESKDLMNLLFKARNHNSIWGAAISNHFTLANTDQEQERSILIEQLASQCVDDIFTMTCVVGQLAVIYLLRTLNK